MPDFWIGFIVGAFCCLVFAAHWLWIGYSRAQQWRRYAHINGEIAERWRDLVNEQASLIAGYADFLYNDDELSGEPVSDTQEDDDGPPIKRSWKTQGNC